MRFLLLFSLLFFAACGSNLSDGEDTGNNGGGSSGGGTVGSQPPFEGRIFTSDFIGSKSTILTLVGSSKRQVTYSLNGTEYTPFVDGNTLYFSSYNNLSYTNIYSIRLTNGEKSPVFLRDYDMILPRKSPSGDHWTWSDADARRIILHTVATGEDSVIFDGFFDIRSLAWFPDNSGFLFHEETFTPRIYRYDMASDTLTYVLNGRYVNIHPAGTHMLYVDGTSLYERNLTAPDTVLIRTEAGIAYPTYSPDGSEIAYTISSKLRIMNRDGSAVRAFPTYAQNIAYPFWVD